MVKVIAVVVTYNRKQLLTECIHAILNQTYKITKLILIDNASTDGTKDHIETSFKSKKKVIDYHLLDKNIGGAGGFYEGLKECLNLDSDYIWIMDDDTIPTPTCLEELITTSFLIKKNFSFMASAIYGPNGEFMNVPNINLAPSENGYAYWYEELENCLVNIRNATFVSLLINSQAARKCGLPCKDYFIWGDDIEYTQRLIKFYGPGYFCGTSKAIHKRANCMALKINNETDISRIKMFHYFYRNTTINNYIYSGKASALKFVIRQSLFSLTLLFKKNGILKFITICKGLFEGIFMAKAVKKFIEGEVSVQ